jgi:phosphoglycerate dehydrogenase-like enzyme
LIGEAQFAQMKPSARLINTSREKIVDEAALLDALRNGTIAGAVIDVLDVEPVRHPRLSSVMPNVIATPHLGFVSRELCVELSTATP